MSGKYVSNAIDHGTTNSAIALMESDGPRIIKPDGVNSIMPSAVYITKRGRMLVGAPAYQAILAQSLGEGTGHTKYKIRIGQDDRYAFDEAKKVMTAPELGGVVLKELLNAAHEETGHEIKTCVITVPAKFEQNACEGTRKAAELAGLVYSPLLQEPIAAAMAYGFNADAERAQWIVFDLGGGTLDVSLVLVRKGQMVVPEEGHAGDNRLGGSKFDREIMDYVLKELSNKYALDEFSENSPKYKAAWGKLMLAIEQAKIDLTRKDQTDIVVDGELCKDQKRKSVSVEIPITREAYEKMIAPDVEKAVHICQTLINANRLMPKDINGLILVGGPTKTPYIQKLLQERLNIELYKDIDPMTAVAQGAALYAATLEIPEKYRDQIVMPESLAGGVKINLEYERKSKLPTYNLVGKLEDIPLDNNRITVEIKRNDGGWQSDPLPVDENGIFMADLQLIEKKKPTASHFTTVVRDDSGNLLATLKEPEIWFPFPSADGRLASSLRVALKGNESERLINKGSALPNQGRGRFLTIKVIRKGSNEDILVIPVLETVTNLLGFENQEADCNVHVGSMTIGGSHERIDRDLPIGSEIDLMMKVDESREISVMAYIPFLDQEFETKFVKGSYGINVEDIKERYGSEKNRLKQIKELHTISPIDSAKDLLYILEKQQTITNIEKEINRATEGEGDACYRAWTRTLELSGAINQIWLDQTEVRLNKHLKKIEKSATKKDKTQIEELRKEVNSASHEDQEKFKILESEVDELDERVRRRPYYSLYLHVTALGGVTMPMDQYNIHLAALRYLESLEEKGAPETLTNEDIKKIEEHDRKLMDAVHDLDKHVQNFLKGLPSDIEPEDAYGTTIKKKTH